MESNTLLELVPHYLAMLLLVFLVLAVVRTLVGDLGFWVEVVIIFVLVFLYRPGAKRLGIAPAAWEN
jgi:hypothetical protein